MSTLLWNNTVSWSQILILNMKKTNIKMKKSRQKLGSDGTGLYATFGLPANKKLRIYVFQKIPSILKKVLRLMMMLYLKFLELCKKCPSMLVCSPYWRSLINWNHILVTAKTKHNNSRETRTTHRVSLILVVLQIHDHHNDSVCIRQSF